MPKGLTRRYGQDHLHFVTFSCHQRLPLVGSANSRNIFVEILSEVRDRHEFALAGYVVMPEHVHLLISEPAKGTPSTVLQVLKQRVSRLDRADHCLPQFWQPRFYDFNLWSLKKKSREAAVHAHESGEARPGVASERSGLEQFRVLRE